MLRGGGGTHGHGNEAGEEKSDAKDDAADEGTGQRDREESAGSEKDSGCCGHRRDGGGEEEANSKETDSQAG